MQDNSNVPDIISQTFSREQPDPRVLVVDGYGVSLTVKRGHVIIEDGIGSTRRTRKIGRVSVRTSNGLARIIVLAASGYISLEVIHWCNALGIMLMQVNRDNQLAMLTTGTRGQDARIRHAQVMCSPGMPHEETGTAILRELLAAKLSGQSENITGWGNSRSIETMKEWSARFHSAVNTAQMTAAEGRAARGYWGAWKEQVFVPFKPGDLKNVPVHWHSFKTRSGFNTEANGTNPTNRNATDPVNSLLNWSYAICLSEAVNACYATGLDPSFGFGHGIDKDTPGMALDLVEPLRPIADSIVLSMLDHGKGIPFSEDGRPAYLSAENFHETADGICRLNPPLTHKLASKVSMAVAPVAGRHAEQIVRRLALTFGIANQGSSRFPVSTDPRFGPRRTLKSSTRTMPLDMHTTTAELVPDSMWTVAHPLIPPEPQVRTHKPNPRADNRAVLAGIIAHEIYGSSWSQIPPGLGVDRKTCRRRLEEWQALGAWEAIKSEITRAGVSQDSI